MNHRNERWRASEAKDIKKRRKGKGSENNRDKKSGLVTKERKRRRAKERKGKKEQGKKIVNENI